MITRAEFQFIQQFFDGMTPFTNRDHQIKKIAAYLIEEHDKLRDRHEKLKKKYKQISRGDK